ncbi:MAG: hypothetical protein D6736_17440 [Nitrospinota bacterium]|nr:MAG: hypothetical protein D6736_17440 [Nitrospinota bacterium]
MATVVQVEGFQRREQVEKQDMHRASILLVIINHAGLGHLNRGLILAQSLQACSTAVAPSLLVNSDLAESFLAGVTIPYWNLPPSRWDGATPTTRKLTAEGAERVKHHIMQHRPEVLVYDTIFVEALVPLFAAQGIRQVWIMRDRKEQVLQEWLRKPVLTYFDLVLVPHHPAEFPSYLLPESIRPKLLFTGPLLRLPSGQDQEAVYQRYGIREEEFVVLFSAGGGNENDDTIRFLDMVNRGCQELVRRYADVRCVVITGMGHRQPVTFARRTRIEVVPFEREIFTLMQRADLFVSEAGYNTCYERILLQSPGILVPVETKIDDQYRRAAYLEQQAGLIVLRDFSPHQLVEQIVHLYEKREELDRMKRRLQSLPISVGNYCAAQAILALLEESSACR